MLRSESAKSKFFKDLITQSRLCALLIYWGALLALGCEDSETPKSRCTLNSDCPSPRLCIEGGCVLECVESELGEQFGWELSSEQSAGMVDHIESASSKMIVRICGVGLVHHLNGL